MKVVILAGGYGTRIRDVANDIPKPMIPIGPYPILWHIMKIYARYGFKDFVVCLGYKSHVIKNFFLNYMPYTRDFTIDLGDGAIQYHSQHDEKDWKVTLVDTGIDAMTGSRISKIKPYVDSSPFMFTYGDGVCDINISDLVEFHQNHGKILTVTGVQMPGRFGEMLGEDNGIVMGFKEKPKETIGSRISGGFFVANPQLFDYLSDDDSLVFEQQPMNELVRDHQLMMYSHNGFWQPMDTSREYHLLNKLYDEGEAPWVG
ncbi:glucose-1-phosphate cytidylyltransferase [Thiotrichales bacterium 19S11-10]|nr:glucose-1-phosphate cytidylyltransferase [Thiotrichales bacterium 19S11-10]